MLMDAGAALVDAGSGDAHAAIDSATSDAPTAGRRDAAAVTPTSVAICRGGSESPRHAQIEPGRG
jgi:hypothetical protein